MQDSQKNDSFYSDPENSDYFAISDMSGNAVFYIDKNGKTSFFDKNKPSVKYWAVIGDSITQGAGVEDIDYDDEFAPIDGYYEISHAKKIYAYYIAKEHNLKWANYGYGGSVLASCNSKAYPNLHPFVDDRILQLKEDVDWDYISIFFGWNDLQFGIVHEKDKWLQETYGEEIGYPVSDSQIGSDGFANSAQTAACNSANGSVGGKEYSDNTDYFVARYIGTINDTTKDTYMGAYNYALEYLMKKYTKSKIMLVIPFLLNHYDSFKEAIVAIANKWGCSYFDFEEMSCWYRKNTKNSTPLINPNSVDGKWYTKNGGSCPSTIDGYNRARLSLDSTHPSDLGYKIMAGPFANKLINS